jgi:hypothetical protein
MMIFLGKQYLEQADKKDITGTFKNPYTLMTDEQLRLENERLANLLDAPQNHKMQIADREVIEIATPSDDTAIDDAK